MTSASHLSRVLAGAALASALCISAAAANPADYYLKIKGVEGETSDDKHKDQIEILSWSWGATQTSTTHTGGGMGAGKVNVQDISLATKPAKGNVEYEWKVEEGESAAAAPGEAEITLKGSKITENAAVSHDLRTNVVARTAASGGVSVAAGDLDGDGRADVVSPRDAASGLPTGKRQHKPLVLATPLDRGSVTVVGRFGGCAVGTRYPELELGGKVGPTYKLKDAIVTSCAMSLSSGGGGGGSAAPMESVSFNYAKIEF